MGKIIDSKKQLEYMVKISNVIGDLNKIEAIFVMEQLLDALKMFEKLDSSQALRKTLEEHGDLIK
ncbi:hypothetical protein LCGC14_0861020 [marine sediment metagenome]|uniref:Uncharacterized protein n=1 Tax=marine sediment metagenome TaxID=412755 RepID=A0A0F9PSS6_9ZZZZ